MGPRSPIRPQSRPHGSAAAPLTAVPPPTSPPPTQAVRGAEIDLQLQAALRGMAASGDAQAAAAQVVILGEPAGRA